MAAQIPSNGADRRSTCLPVLVQPFSLLFTDTQDSPLGCAHDNSIARLSSQGLTKELAPTVPYKQTQGTSYGIFCEYLATTTNTTTTTAGILLFSRSLTPITATHRKHLSSARFFAVSYPSHMLLINCRLFLPLVHFPVILPSRISRNYLSKKLRWYTIVTPWCTIV